MGVVTYDDKFNKSNCLDFCLPVHLQILQIKQPILFSMEIWEWITLISAANFCLSVSFSKKEKKNQHFEITLIKLLSSISSATTLRGAKRREM
jgi:hypothetical protein